MNYPAASSGVSPSLLCRHSVLDLACPALDAGESSVYDGSRLSSGRRLDTGFRRYDEFAASSGENNPKGFNGRTRKTRGVLEMA